MDGLAVAGLVCAVSSLGLLVFSLGLSFFFSLPLGGAGWVCAARSAAPRRGEDPLDHRRRPQRHRRGRVGDPDLGRLQRRGAPAQPRAGARTAATAVVANLNARDPEPVREAVPDDRRADARAPGRLAGDGRPDALPPGPELRRALRAGAGQAAAGLPDRERRPHLRRQRLRRHGVRRRQPRAPRQAGARRRRRQVRRALARAGRRPRGRGRALRAGLGRAPRPRRVRPPADREPRDRRRLRHAERDVDRHRPRRPGDRGGHARPTT